MAKKKIEEVKAEDMMLEAQEEQLEEEYSFDNIEDEEEYVDEDDGLLFPGGPTLDQVEEWKSRFTNIYATEFEEDIFIWRPLTRIEYKEVLKVKNADAMYREERICEKCVLWPENYSFVAMSSGGAGQPTILSEQIMEKSGFVAAEATRL